MPTKKGGRKAVQRKASKAKRREIASKAIANNLAKALSHPMRVDILTILNDRMASPNELAKLFEEGLSQVSYHVKVLRDFDMIELVKTEPRRGAVEHYYKAVTKVIIPSWVAELWPKSVLASVFAGRIEEVGTDLAESVRAGLFADRPDAVAARDSRYLDDQGRADVEKAVVEFYERFEKAASASAKRLTNGESTEKIQTTASVLVHTSLKGRGLQVGKRKDKKKS